MSTHGKCGSLDYVNVLDEMFLGEILILYVIIVAYVSNWEMRFLEVTLHACAFPSLFENNHLLITL